MDRETEESIVKDKFAMYRWEIMYRPEQQEVISRFIEFCKRNGYNRVAGIQTLLDYADYHKHLLVLADKILDINKELANIRVMLESEEGSVEALESPKTLGG